MKNNVCIFYELKNVRKITPNLTQNPLETKPKTIKHIQKHTKIAEKNHGAENTHQNHAANPRIDIKYTLQKPRREIFIPRDPFAPLYGQNGSVGVKHYFIGNSATEGA